jgi:hypothetical protein
MSNCSKTSNCSKHTNGSKPIPLSVRHSTRPAALNAAQRISDYCKRDMANSDSDESYSPPISPIPPTQSDYELSHPEEKKYMYTVNIIRYLINECNNAEFEDQRIQTIEKILDHLNKNPSILIYEPKFRTSVINKMKEIETHINNRMCDFNNAKYNEILSAIRVSIRANVRNSVMRSALYTHFNGIKSILTEYESWSKGESLLAHINTFYGILDTIKKYPFYVTSN